MPRRRVSNPLALAVLSCLRERPMHPYEISTTLRSRGKEGSIKLNYGSLYSVVEALNKHGLIEPQETERAGRRPERTVYAITPAGSVELEDWLSELLSTPVREFSSLEAGLSLMPVLPPEQVAQLLDSRATALLIEIRSMDAAHEVAVGDYNLPELFVVEGRYRRAILAAELEFVTALVKSIRAGSLGGSTFWSKLHERYAEGMTYAEIMADPVANLGEEAAALTSEQN